MSTSISIIIPIYNAASYLRECLDSVLMQSFTDFELILVNDGSIDNSLTICEEYSQKDKRIRVIDSPNCGVSAARNKGLQMASGRWITFVDADDYFLNNALSILYERAMQTGADFVLANALKLKNGKYSELHSLKNGVMSTPIMSIKHFALWGYLFNGNIIRKYGLRFIDGLAYSEDRIFIYQMARYCKTIAFCNKPIYVYRINDTSACASRDGVRKACQHIDAAYYLDNIAQAYKSENKCIFNYLHKQRNHVIKLGLYQFFYTNTSIRKLSIVTSQYKKRFGTGWINLMNYYIFLVNSCFTYYRRQIIKFKK